MPKSCPPDSHAPTTSSTPKAKIASGPPVYGPGATPVAQRKDGAPAPFSVPKAKIASGPPVYRPGATPVAQRKGGASAPFSVPKAKITSGPPVYRPGATPVAQRKGGAPAPFSVPQTKIARGTNSVKSPPVYIPDRSTLMPKFTAPKPVAAILPKIPAAPFTTSVVQRSDSWEKVKHKMDDALELNRMRDSVSSGVLTISDVRLAMTERQAERRQSAAASAVTVSSSSAAAAPASASAAAAAAAKPTAQDSWAVPVFTPKPRPPRKTHKDLQREREARDREAQEKLIAEILADPAKFVASTEKEIERLPNARKLGGTTKKLLAPMTALAKLITSAMESASKKGLAMDLIAAARDAKRKAGAEIEAIEAEEARLAAIEAVQESFLAGDKLLIGAITTVKRGLEEPLSEEAFRNALQAVYVKQCTVTRLNWMLHLGIAGVNTDGPSNGTHFTKYNNALVSDVDLGSWRVDLHSVAETATKLFASVASGLQIHATTVGADGTRYHKYWDGTYSATADPPYDRTALDAEYDRMCQYMLTRVTSAKTSHGRVGANDRGQQLFT